MDNPLTTQVKICGLSDAQSIDAAIDGGASHIGFIFFAKSPRNVSPQLARSLASPVKGRVQRVAVSVDAGNDVLDEIVAIMEPDILQLHGHETPERVVEIKKRYALPALKSFAIRQASDFKVAEGYIDSADRLLFDAKPPAGSDLPGGNGVSFDWNLFAQWQNAYGRKLNEARSEIESAHRHIGNNLLDSVSPPMLSGGVNLDNVVEALTSSKTSALDISSGVEKRPGVKDPALIKTLLDKVRQFDDLRAQNAPG